MDRLHGKAAQAHLLAGADLVEPGAGGQAVFLQLVAHQADGQPGGVDGHIELPQQVGQAADVVLVPVGDKKTLDAVLVLQHVGEIRDDQVDAEHVAVREHRTAVHQDHIALALVQGNVLAHFAQAAQRADVHGDGGLLLHAGRAGHGPAARARSLLERLDLLRGGRRGGGRVCRAARARGARGTLRAGGLLHGLDSRGGFLRFGSRRAAGTARRGATGRARRFGTGRLTFVVEIFH